MPVCVCGRDKARDRENEGEGKKDFQELDCLRRKMDRSLKGGRRRKGSERHWQECKRQESANVGGSNNVQKEGGRGNK